MLAPETRFFLTGAASGIGAATLDLLVRHGQRVAAADVNRVALRQQCEPLGDRALAINLDVRDATQWERALDEVWDRWGGVDVLINNAGLVHTGLAHELPREKLLHMIDVNVGGVAHGCCSAIPRFLKQGHGHVINIASLASFVPMEGQAMYAGTKHAVRAFTHGLALELRHTPLKFTVVCPAAVETPMLDQQIADDYAVLSFADPSLTPEQVAQGILRAANEQPREILLPAGRGRLLKLAGLFPGLVERMLAGAEKRGRKELAKRRAAAAGGGS